MHLREGCHEVPARTSRPRDVVTASSTNPTRVDEGRAAGHDGDPVCPILTEGGHDWMFSSFGEGAKCSTKLLPDHSHRTLVGRGSPALPPAGKGGWTGIALRANILTDEAGLPFTRATVQGLGFRLTNGYFGRE